MPEMEIKGIPVELYINKKDITEVLRFIDASYFKNIQIFKAVGTLLPNLNHVQTIDVLLSLYPNMSCIQNVIEFYDISDGTDRAINVAVAIDKYPTSIEDFDVKPYTFYVSQNIDKLELELNNFIKSHLVFIRFQYDPDNSHEIVNPDLVSNKILIKTKAIYVPTKTLHSVYIVLFDCKRQDIVNRIDELSATESGYRLSSFIPRPEEFEAPAKPQVPPTPIWFDPANDKHYRCTTCKAECFIKFDSVNGDIVNYEFRDPAIVSNSSHAYWGYMYHQCALLHKIYDLTSANNLESLGVIEQV